MTRAKLIQTRSLGKIDGDWAKPMQIELRKHGKSGEIVGIIRIPKVLPSGSRIRIGFADPDGFCPEIGVCGGLQSQFGCGFRFHGAEGAKRPERSETEIHRQTGGAIRSTRRSWQNVEEEAQPFRIRAEGGTTFKILRSV